MIKVLTHTSAATRNACRVCAPLGSSLVFLGVENCMPLVHGGQGCSTYIRRYLIGHFREPVDIASTNFSESSAVFGGGKNLLDGIANIVSQYRPELIGISTTCLSETMGEDLPTLLRDFGSHVAADCGLPTLVHVSTPSYKGSHRDGFYAAVLALVSQLAKPKPKHERLHWRVNLFPGFVSPADIRHLVEMVRSFGLDPMVLPDYSQTLDDGQWKTWQVLPRGGTSLDGIRQSSSAGHTVEFELPTKNSVTAGEWLEKNCAVPNSRLPLPIGVEACDQFCQALARISGNPVPPEFAEERKRLVDSYVDAHKYAFGLRVAIFGDEEMVAALARFAVETGMVPVLCVTGGSTERIHQALKDLDCPEEIHVLGTADYEDVAELCRAYRPALLLGPSKGYVVARMLDIPLVRVGFPVQDRMGGPRLLHVGYKGTQRLFDQIINTWLEYEQAHSPVGYKTY